MVYTTRELSVKTYPDFEKLAAKQGGCWCTVYQRAKPLRTNLSREARKQVNRKFKAKLVRENRSHAALVYEGEIPIGWCQYGTDDELPSIDAWRTTARSRPCQEKKSPGGLLVSLWIGTTGGRKGVARAALKAALTSIQNQEGGVVEAYSVVSKEMAWTGLGTPGMFEKEGFTRVAALGKCTLLMRKTIAAK